MILSLVIGPKISNLLVAILTGLFSWSWTVRAVDPMTRSIKARDFINVARLNGSDSFEIAFGEILPVILPYVVIVYIIQFNAAIMTIVTLNLFGIGSLSIATWGGTMLYWSVIATAFAYGIWWWYVPPGFLTAWTTLALILMVRGLNKIFNPRLRGGDLMSENILSVDGLKAYYFLENGLSVKAVDDVSFTVNENDVLGIVGESGSGKSTLAIAISALTKPPPLRIVNGKVLFKGTDILKLDNEELRRIRMKHISLIPQFAMDALNPTITIKRLLRDALKSHIDSDEKIEEIMNSRVPERLSMIGLPKWVLDRYPFELSGGMRQRVSIMISTILDPDLLIADEPTSSLDVVTQRLVIQFLNELVESRRVKSMLFITHDIGVIAQLANRIGVMYAGKLIEVGNANDILKEPLHPYTKALIMSIPKYGTNINKIRLKGLKGEPPSLVNPPKGCRFYDRCPYRMDICREKEPPFVKVGSTMVACWLFAKGGDQ